MAFTFGFYNSLKGDRRYNAEQFGEIFDGILRDGIIPSIGQLFAVTTANNGMQINVGTGRAWFNHTWNKNDSIMVLTVPLSDVTRSRYDAVVLEVNANDEIRANSIKIVQGEPLVNPVKPTLVNTAKIHQYPLAYIKVEAGTEVIKASMIENMVGREPTVFATGVLEVAPIDTLWEQWRGEWNEWFEGIKLQLSGNVVTNLQYQIDQLNSKALTDERKASVSEAKAGTNNTKWMTPYTTAQVIDANLGYVKDTFGNKSVITVRDPATITWSKIGPIASSVSYGYGTSSKRLDVGDYILLFTLENKTNTYSASARKGYFYSFNYEMALSFTMHVTITRKSDFVQTYSGTLGSCTKPASVYGYFVCDQINGVKNKIIYSIGQSLYLGTVTANGITKSATISSSFEWTTSSRVREQHVIVATSQNYAFVGIYYTYEMYEGYGKRSASYMCNLNTYAVASGFPWVDDATAYCLTNSGMLYSYLVTAATNPIITVQEINLNGAATATFTINIQSYNSSFSAAGICQYDVFYDWVYDRIVFGIRGATSNATGVTGNLWLAVLNGRNVVGHNTMSGIPAGTESFSFVDYDISSHNAIWKTYIMTYTSSSTTIRSVASSGYGDFSMILSGYGYLTSSDVLLRTDLSSITLVDRTIANDTKATIVSSSTSPLGFIGLVSTGSGTASVLFKVTNTVYIRD